MTQRAPSHQKPHHPLLEPDHPSPKRQKLENTPFLSRNKGNMPGTMGLVAPSDVDFRRASNYSQHTVVKKLVVKNLRQTPRVNLAEHYETITSQLFEALGAIFRGEKPKQPLERLYRFVEEICRNNRSQALYERLEAYCREHITNGLLPPILEQARTGYVVLKTLKEVQRSWDIWTRQSVWISPW
jgi:hypothetical protein